MKITFGYSHLVQQSTQREQEIIIIRNRIYDILFNAHIIPNIIAVITTLTEINLQPFWNVQIKD